MPIYKDFLQQDAIVYLKKDSLEKLVLYPCCVDPAIDSNGNFASYERKPLPIDTSKKTLSFITQILYVQNGKLETYIPWINPEIINNEIFDWVTSYFSACFNFKYNEIINDKNKIIDLGQTKKKLLIDSVKTEDKLKELYGRNLIETLWPYILDSSIAVFSYEKTKKIRPGEIIEDLINTVRITVPVYDTLGNISSYTVPQIPLSPKAFTSIELVQDWYYDYTKNIVFNKIKTAYLYARKWTTGIQEKEPSPILKIVFN